ncbi:MAG: imidazole glycerol phosphate synthase subunit HisH, partial [Firmicutes bacterium]|nr:imidazole glycerol phosphate synthase subunit HisH [Bacillota bacterium]
MIAIVDYGVGNLYSVQKALLYIGYQSHITADPEQLLAADGIVLPGVGAFGDAMARLTEQRLVPVLHEVAACGKPLLGICLGMQLLFSGSDEHGPHEGLGMIAGRVKRMVGDYKIPHVGWNELAHRRTHPILEGTSEGDYAYFVHSYYAVPEDDEVVLATTDYDQDLPAAVAQGSVIGLQFHPEKSAHT